MNPPTNDSSDIYCLKKIRFEINGSVYLFLIRGGGQKYNSHYERDRRKISPIHFPAG